MSQTVQTLKKIAASEEYRALAAALESYLRRIVTAAFGEVTSKKPVARFS